jgi:sporulation protein YlmC with PRC-barrel domain
MATMTTDRPQVLSASTIIGDDVHNPQGEKLGNIKELMLDLDTGHVAYAVLSFGGFLGMGDKLFAVPFQALKLNPERENFTLDVPKERLEQAPGFDQDNWPSTGDRVWGQEIHAYYGYEPYWNRR